MTINLKQMNSNKPSLNERFRFWIIIKVLCLLGLFIVLVSCASVTLRLPVQRKPLMDTSGIKRIAVMPFDGGGRYSDTINYATTQAISSLQATNAFILINASTIDDVRRRREHIENYVDALFSGKIISVEINQPEPEINTWTDKKGVTHTSTTFNTIVEIELSYHFTKTRDGSMIGPKTRSKKKSESSDKGYPSVENLAKLAVDDIFKEMRTDVAPYTTFVSRTLQKDKLNKKLQKNQMNDLAKQVKAGNYISSKREYINIWNIYQSIAAAINASYLMEATGETSEAISLMQDVYSTTGSPLVNSRLNELNREVFEKIQLENYLAEGKNPILRVSENAVNEITKVISPNQKIWIHNNATQNQNLVSDIIDNITSSFISNGIIIVERQQIDKIIKEQNFQLSGFVFDDDIVRIGGIAGASSVILVNTVGTGANRRLSVRVLDVETGVVKMQSSAGSEWNF